MRQPCTYAYFSIPKVFVQNIDKRNKENPITEIHAIETMTSYGKSNKLRYVHYEMKKNKQTK